MRQTRRQLLKTTAALGPALMLSRFAAPAHAAGDLRGMNVVVFLTAQHRVKYTLEAKCSPPQNPQVELPLDLPNLATVMATAGLNPVYKGRFHCVKAAAGGENWVPQDVGQYGWTRWNPPDAGPTRTSTRPAAARPTTTSAT